MCRAARFNARLLPGPSRGWTARRRVGNLKKLCAPAWRVAWRASLRVAAAGVGARRAGVQVLHFAGSGTCAWPMSAPGAKNLARRRLCDSLPARERRVRGERMPASVPRPVALVASRRFQRTKLLSTPPPYSQRHSGNPGNALQSEAGPERRLPARLAVGSARLTAFGSASVPKRPSTDGSVKASQYSSFTT